VIDERREFAGGCWFCHRGRSHGPRRASRSPGDARPEPTPIFPRRRRTGCGKPWKILRRRKIGIVPTDHRAEFELVSVAAKRLRDAGFGDAVVAIQTGSGLAAPDLESRRTIEWTDIPGFPRATAPGHRGAIHHGTFRGAPVLVLEGRVHLYEGREAAEVIRVIRAVGLLGVKSVVLTNAAGGVRESLVAGDVVRVADHVNLQRVDPLAGVHDPRFGDRFVVTAGRSHDRTLARYADEAAAEAGIRLHSGVYAALPGPSFETPAEVRMLRTLGVDVVGMSTVPEILAATQLGMRVLALSFVANPAGVVKDDATAEAEVLAAGASLGAGVTRIVEGVVARIAAERRTAES
jgi:purine-nucleoside phosphorylase